jgi:CelD/BcsL family acetyltransferase involved in cellulose biosynthesis
MQILSETAAADRKDTPADTALVIVRVADVDTLMALEDDWNRLYRESGLDPFNSWAWQVSWWQHWSDGRALWVLVAHDAEGRAQGIVPLYCERRRVGLLPVRRLGFLGDTQVGSDYLDLIAVPEARQRVIDAVADYLAGQQHEWDLIEWRDMDGRSDSPTRLARALGAGFRASSTPGECCPGQWLPPEQRFDSFLPDTRRASNFLRRKRWFERQADFRMEVAVNGTSLSEAREHFFRLHAQRWSGEGGSAGIPDARVRAFHEAATDRLAGLEAVRFYTLWVGGEAVASVYALWANRTLYYYQSGMDPAWRCRSAGLVLIGETFADAFRLGARRYDFLRGEESYKWDWVGEQRRLSRWRLYRRSGRGQRASLSDAGLRRTRAWLKRLLFRGLRRASQ